VILSCILNRINDLLNDVQDVLVTPSHSKPAALTANVPNNVSHLPVKIKIPCCAVAVAVLFPILICMFLVAYSVLSVRRSGVLSWQFVCYCG